MPKIPTTLRQGSKGEEVRKLQEQLKAQGFDPGTIDADFGPKTAAAVEAFQKARGLTIDALVGPKTMGALYKSYPEKEIKRSYEPWLEAGYGSQKEWQEAKAVKEPVSDIKSKVADIETRIGELKGKAVEMKTKELEGLLEQKKTFEKAFELGLPKEAEPTLDEAKTFVAEKTGLKFPSEVGIPKVTDAEDLAISEVITPTIPTPEAPAALKSYTEGLFNDLVNKRQALDDLYTKQIEEIRKSKADLETRISELETKQEGVLTGDIKPLLEPFRADLEKTERERLKLEENYFANQNSVQELETLLTQAMGEISAEEEVTGLSAIRLPRIAKLKEDMAARVGIIEAVMSARNNQIIVAENMIDRSVGAIEADRKDQLSYYQTLFNFYEEQKDEEGNKLFALESNEKEFLSKQIGLIESDLAESKENINYIKELMMSPETANIMEQSGVKLTDSISEIQEKFANYTYRQELTSLHNTMETQGFEYLAIPEAVAGKPEEELVRLVDSKGKERVYWKKPDIEEEEVLSVSEAKALGVPYGTTKKMAQAMGITIKETPTAADKKIVNEDWMNEVSNLNPDATYEELYSGIRGERADISESTIKDWLERQGKKSVGTIKKETERTWPDTKIKSRVESSYKEGYTRNDIITTFEGTNMSEADKKRASELVNEAISDEMNEWLQKSQDEPDKYVVEEEGVKELVKGWFDKWAYKF